MRLAALSAVFGVSVLAGCSTYNSLTERVVQRITPYRVTIVQGNFVSSDTAAKLHVGMSRDEVRALLGTPLLTDMFHPERWDYIFYFKRGSTNVVQQRDLVINFTGDTVVSWSGAEDLPSNQDLIAMIDGDKKESNLLKEKRDARKDAGSARAADAAAASGASAGAAKDVTPATPVSKGTPANQQAADAANNALATAPTRISPSARNVPQSAVVHGGPGSPVQSAPEPQFTFTTPSHLRPAGGGSLLAQPPALDGTAAPATAAPAP
jgi:outer membrane protein assembly factor BamE